MAFELARQIISTWRAEDMVDEAGAIRGLDLRYRLVCAAAHSPAAFPIRDADALMAVNQRDPPGAI